MTISASELQQKIRHLIPLYEHFDLRIESVANTLRVSIPLTERSATPNGGIHAALQFAAGEALGGLAFYLLFPDTKSHWGVVREMTIRFRKPATTDIRAEAVITDSQLASARMQLEADGRADITLEGRILNAEDTVVATTTATYHVRRRDKSS